MAKLYLNKGSLRVTQDTGVNLTGATATVMKYRKPDGTEGSWLATVIDETKIYHDFAENELNQTGPWARWAHVTFSDGRTQAGNPVDFIVYTEGT